MNSLFTNTQMNALLKNTAISMPREGKKFLKLYYHISLYSIFHVPFFIPVWNVSIGVEKHDSAGQPHYK